MFTGIVEHVGTVLAVKASPAGRRLRLDLGPLHTGAEVGASFAVDGVCLTVADHAGRDRTRACPSRADDRGLASLNLGQVPPSHATRGSEADKGLKASDTWAEFDVVPETLSRTTLGRLRAHNLVNLERSLPASGRVDGHFVQGHVDTTATVLQVSKIGGQVQLTCALDDPEQAIYVVAKGSIAVNGVSLTVADVEGATFRVALIPTTLAKTTLGARLVGDRVNIETDILARIVVNYLMRGQGQNPASPGSVTFEQLREAGWL